MANVSPLVIQYLMKNRAVTEQELKNFVNQVNVGNVEIEISSLFDRIKDTLNSFNLTIELTRCELTGVKYFILLSTVERECFSDYPMLSKLDEDCLYALIEEIMNSGGNPLGSNDAINLLLGLDKPIRPDTATEILKSFTSKRLLVENGKGCYCLGPLVLTELKNYLSSHANAKSCSLCTKEVVYGKSCESCGAEMHNYCFEDAQQMSQNSDCPSCSQ